jgi:hypothetical protein
MGGRSLATEDVSQLGRDIFPVKQQPAAGKRQKKQKQQAKKISGPEYFFLPYPSFLLGRSKITSPTPLRVIAHPCLFTWCTIWCTSASKFAADGSN